MSAPREEQAVAAGHRSRRLNVPRALEDRAHARAQELTGQPPTFRSTVALAVSRELEHVVALLTEAGLVHGPGDRARPRETDDAIWEKLEAAEKVVSCDKVGLVRCCLERLARNPGNGAGQ
jgi:hypothetical protein